MKIAAKFLILNARILAWRFLTWFISAAAITSGACVGIFYGLRLLDLIVRK